MAHTQPPAPRTAWRRVRYALRPRATRAQLLVGLLCALLGFGVVLQVRQTQEVGLSGLRQSDLVRLLDDVTQRSAELEETAAGLRATRQELLSGTDRQRAALEAARERAVVQGILAGRLPAEGPGLEIVLYEDSGRIPALTLFNVLEELRNAGAEAVQLNEQRLVASSYFVDGPDGVVVDGVELRAPYRWVAIGDPQTLSVALEIPGGALSAVRNAGGSSSAQERERVEVSATRTPRPPQFATPVPPESDSG